MATIIDVAKRAGVSAATVSRVLGGNYPVAGATKQAVMRAVEELHYVPNPAGQILRGKSSRTVFVVFPTLEISERLMSGVQEVLGEHNLDAVFIQRRRPDDLRAYEMMRSIPFYGIINLEDHPVTEEYARLQKIGPVVQFSSTLFPRCGSAAIRVNNEQMAYQLAQYLFQKGAGSLGVPVMTDGNGAIYPFLQERMRGVERAADEAGIPHARIHTYFCNIERSAMNSEGYAFGEKLAKQCVAQHCVPDAFLGFWDALAVGFARGCQKSGLRIPQDILIAGFEGREAAIAYNPSITTLDQSYHKLGQALANRLIALREKSEEPMEQEYTSRIVERESTMR